jgi:hypothetical protein
MRFFLYTLLILSFSLVHAKERDVIHDYVSKEDQYLTMRKLGVGPVKDNRSEIYSKPAHELLEQLIERDHQFEFRRLKGDLLSWSPDRVIKSPASAAKFLRKSGIDGFLTLRISRNLDNIQFVLRLHHADDGKVLIERTINNYPRLDIEGMELALTDLYGKTLGDLPYQGMILSRTGRKVTINIGSENGVKKGDVLQAVQIFNFKRHPKYQFVVNTTKQVIGKVKLTKVDPTLSFGYVTEEKEVNLIRQNSKIEVESFIKYPEITDKTIGPGLPGEQAHLYGKDAREWKPEEPPTFGRAYASLGLGNYSGSFVLETLGDQSTSASLATALNFGGELWVTPKFIVNAGIKQSIIPSSKPSVGGSLTIDTLRTSLYGYYLLPLKGDFFGPKISVGFGGQSYKYNLDRSTELTSLLYSGYGLAIGGSFPLSGPYHKYTIGGELRYFFSTTLKETPVTSAASNTPRMSYFNIFGEKKITERVRWRANWEVELYASNFSGSGTRSSDRAVSASQSLQTLSMEFNYLF